MRLRLDPERKAAELACERDGPPAAGASQIRRVTSLAEGCDFIDAVEIFREAETSGRGQAQNRRGWISTRC